MVVVTVFLNLWAIIKYLYCQSYVHNIFVLFFFIKYKTQTGIGWCAYESPLDLENTIHDDYLKAMYLSKRDFAGYTTAALSVDLSNHDGFMAAFVVSQNKTCPFDLDESSRLLGYVESICLFLFFLAIKYLVPVYTVKSYIYYTCSSWTRFFFFFFTNPGTNH